MKWLFVLLFALGQALAMHPPCAAAAEPQTAMARIMPHQHAPLPPADDPCCHAAACVAPPLGNAPAMAVPALLAARAAYLPSAFLIPHGLSARPSLKPPRALA
jgi:hypothetical protein